VASHNVLRAHAAAVAEFRRLVPGGRISMNINGDWAEPYTQSEADKVLHAQLALQHPLLYLCPSMVVLCCFVICHGLGGPAQTQCTDGTGLTPDLIMRMQQRNTYATVASVCVALLSCEVARPTGCGGKEHAVLHRPVRRPAVLRGLPGRGPRAGAAPAALHAGGERRAPQLHRLLCHEPLCIEVRYSLRRCMASPAGVKLLSSLSVYLFCHCSASPICLLIHRLPSSRHPPCMPRYVMASEAMDERDPFRWEGAAQTDKDASGRPIGPKADSAWLNVCPDGFRKTLNWISDR